MILITLRGNPPSPPPKPIKSLQNFYLDHGHLKFKDKPLWLVILASWGIAFFEYCFQVPANRWGNSVYSAAQLKIIQEVITLSVFVVFAIFYLGEKIRWNYVAAFGCILAAVAFAFWPQKN